MRRDKGGLRKEERRAIMKGLYYEIFMHIYLLIEHKFQINNNNNTRNTAASDRMRTSEQEAAQTLREKTIVVDSAMRAAFVEIFIEIDKNRDLNPNTGERKVGALIIF